METEAKLMDVNWEKSCADDTVCLNPHHAPGGYAAPTHCVEEYRHVCHLSPALYPVIKKVPTHRTKQTLKLTELQVVIKLPKPVETCINKQVLLPRLECDQVIYLTCSVFFQFLILCHQVHERRCMLAPRTQPGPTIKLDKCSVVVGEPACSDTVLQLPRQVCT